MGRGRRPDSNRDKDARGSRQPRLENVVEFPVVDETPKPPTYLKLKASKDLWNDVAPTLFQQRILTTADVHALGHLCQLHGEVTGCYRKGIPVAASTLAQLRMYFAEFGMTPASRTKVAAGDKGSTGNKFKNNGGSRER